MHFFYLLILIGCQITLKQVDNFFFLVFKLNIIYLIKKTNWNIKYSAKNITNYYKSIYNNKNDHLPRRRSLISLAAWIPSSFKFFSICLLRARDARSSALMAHPMITAWIGPRATLLVYHLKLREKWIFKPFINNESLFMII